MSKNVSVRIISVLLVVGAVCASLAVTSSGRGAVTAGRARAADAACITCWPQPGQ